MSYVSSKLDVQIRPVFADSVTYDVKQSYFSRNFSILDISCKQFLRIKAYNYNYYGRKFIQEARITKNP